MNTVELIYQEAKDLPETDARDVLDFVEFLKAKRQSELKSPAFSPHRESKADMSEFDQFGSVYDGHFDRDACYDRPSP
jgi:hypothetical protein